MADAEIIIAHHTLQVTDKGAASFAAPFVHPREPAVRQTRIHHCEDEEGEMKHKYQSPQHTAFP
jgi:hypothetical protein